MKLNITNKCRKSKKEIINRVSCENFPNSSLLLVNVINLHRRIIFQENDFNNWRVAIKNCLKKSKGGSIKVIDGQTCETMLKRYSTTNAIFQIISKT